LNHLSLEQLTQLLCQPVLNLPQPPMCVATQSMAAGSPHSAHGELSSSSPPLLQSGAASHRMEWIQTQPAWMQLSSEAQTLVRKLVHLLESVPSAPSSTGSIGAGDASGRSHSVVSPHPGGAVSPGSDRSSTPSNMVSTACSTSSTVYSSSQPGAMGGLGASPQGGDGVMCSPTSAPVEGSAHPNPLAYLQRTQSEPQREGSPLPDQQHRSSDQIPTFPIPSSNPHPQQAPVQSSPAASPGSSRLAVSSPTIHINASALSSDSSSEDSDSAADAYDRHAAVLSPISAPHGDHLHSQARRLARHSSSADSLKPVAIGKALEEKTESDEAKQSPQ